MSSVYTGLTQLGECDSYKVEAMGSNPLTCTDSSMAEGKATPRGEEGLCGSIPLWLGASVSFDTYLTIL